MSDCDMRALSEFNKLQEDCGGRAGAGGVGGAQPIRVPYPGGYGCPDDCIGDHWFGLVAEFGQPGVSEDGTIAAGATASITVQPQKKCQVRRLYIPESVVDNFRGVDLVIGVEPFNITKDPFSLAQWLPNSVCPDMRRIVCSVSQKVVLKVTNKSESKAPFDATASAYMLAD